MTDPNPIHDARMLGPERTAALVMAAVSETAPNESIAAAARRLAQPEPAAPQWPERVWVTFNKRGEFMGVHASDGSAARCGEAGYTVLPARLVPLDGSRVVLTREDAHRLRNLAAEYQRWTLTSGEDEKGTAALDRALAEAPR